MQFNFPSVTVATLDSAGAVVHIVSGTGTVIAYGSVVDDATGDASYIAGGTASAGSVNPLSLLLKRR